ncbi:MAG: protease HtpX [Cobetia sp.]|jgi:heat shock protein HtpX|uniref:Protease HtpX n=1 Tax=Cobetia amphilecti TaxID=1055104 RepID=A0AAP4TZ38_9GAMM|nr:MULTISPECIES: protease HtpX [Cobetia]AVV34723.1 protease HtpX [Halomonas sp. SF2003]MBR9755926.1 protease HtpX [Gammaproteobacteria bacterium]TCJ26976.1 protease HtpX [Halomonas sp. GDM18]MBE2166906.1 protease HtpX [Cobetia sp. 2AS1]MBF09540.1 protease HtpX [Cobetia sp.]|tara:strand:+ start:3619 stop:4518 length:900 start_codon:yes stop_codon:yes gene_type:complete
MMRIALFLITNLAVVLLASVTLRLLGFDGYMEANGINYTALLIFCFIIGMAGSVISLFLSKTMAKSSTGTVIIEQPQNDTERWLLDTVGELARDAGIKMPEVGIFPAQQSNAFATGWNRNDALVAVSAGLLNRMRPEEVRAVLAHEIGHVANGDMVTLTLIQGVVNTFVMFFARIAAHAIDAFLKRDDENGGLGFFGYMAVVFVLEMVLGLVASMIVAWFSRWREYRADAAGAGLAGSGSMINALARLKQEHELPDQMPDTMTAFAITTGKSRKLMEQLFASHPPLDDRIAALKAAAYK